MSTACSTDGHGLAVGVARREWARAGDRDWRDLGGLGLGVGLLTQIASTRVSLSPPDGIAEDLEGLHNPNQWRVRERR